MREQLLLMLPPWLDWLAFFHFLRPWWLLGIPAILAAVWYYSREQGSMRGWRKAIRGSILQALTVRGGGRGIFSPVTLGAIVGVLFSLVMAGPSWERQDSPFAEDHAPLIIMLDVGESMDQKDIQPSRLERAKQKISDLMEIRGSARTGLIVFAGSAHVAVPLTSDPDVMQTMLAAINTKLMPESGKRAEDALEQAENMLSGLYGPATMLLISDGVGPETQPAFRAWFQRLPHGFITLGVGLDSDAQAGATVEAALPLERRRLMSLAEAAGGYYLDVSVDRTDVSRISRLVRVGFETGEDKTRPWIDAGFWLVPIACLLFLMWFRRGWTLNWNAGLLLVFLLWPNSELQAADFRFMDLWMTPDQQGHHYFERGEYGEAARRFEDPVWRATALYMNQDFDAAAILFARYSDARSRFALGNALAHARRYRPAIVAYREVLMQDPTHEGAQRNLEMVTAVLEEMMKIAEDRPPEQGEGEAEQIDEDKLQRSEDEDLDQQPAEEELTAEDLLADPEKFRLWMRRVQPDPARFLKAKFQNQVQKRKQAEAEELADGASQ